MIPGASSSSTMRSIFIGASLCWNIAAVAIGVSMAVHAISSVSGSLELELAGWFSVGFSGVIGLQGFLAFVKLKISLQRYVRFGLTSAAFSRTPPKLATAYIIVSLIGFILYVLALMEFIEATRSSIPDEARSGRLGVISFSILGVTMASLLIGLTVVSRIPAWASQAFVQTPSSHN